MQVQFRQGAKVSECTPKWIRYLINLDYGLAVVQVGEGSNRNTGGSRHASLRCRTERRGIVLIKVETMWFKKIIRRCRSVIALGLSGIQAMIQV